MQSGWIDRACRALLPLLVLATSRGIVPADVSGAEALKGLTVSEDRRAGETLYRPAYDTWTLYEFRTYPILRRDARGERSLLLYASARGERRTGIKRLDVEIDGVVHTLTPPQIIRSTKVAPEFPVMARDRMARGKVTLHAVVRLDGTTDVRDVFKSSARYCGFEQAAIDAVRQWRYIPGQKDGKPVDIYFTIDIDFVWR